MNSTKKPCLRRTKMKLVAASVRERKAPFPRPHTSKLARKVGQPVDDEADHLAFSLDLAIDTVHARAWYDAAILLENHPDHQVRMAGLILDVSKHDTFSRTPPPTHQHQAGILQPFAIASIHRFFTGTNASLLEIVAWEAQ
ncbi:hypothetical protein FB593_11621 [Rhizobium sp. SJZ105]|nr:hypothetical protein FB593_11621 [Rhizobium sp. SJZ105]